MSYKFNPLTGKLDYYEVGGSIVETDPIWNSEKSNYYTMTQTNNTFVPYIGAFSDVNLGIQNLATDGIGTFGKVKTGVIYPSINSTTAVQINRADGTTNVFNVDTINNRVGIGTTTPGAKLHISDSSPELWLEATSNNRMIKFTPGTGGIDSVNTAFHINRYSDYAVAIGYSSGYATLRVGGAAWETPALIYVGNIKIEMPNMILQAANGQTADILRWRNSSGVGLGVINNVGNVGIGAIPPTAALHLKAGTASAGTAPLKFTSGTLLSTEETGAIEFNVDTWYMTSTNGVAGSTKRQGIPGVTKGTSAPTTTPVRVGDIYVDTANHKVYIADGTTDSSNWLLLN